MWPQWWCLSALPGCSTAPYVHSTSNVLRALQIFELTIEFVKVKENYYKTSALYSMRKLFRFFNQWVVWVEKSRTFGTQYPHKMQQSCQWWLENPFQSLAMLLSSVKKLLSPQLLIIYPILVCNKVYCQSYTWTNISVAQNNLHRSWKLERCRRASPGELTLIQLRLIKLSMIIIINCRRIRSRNC